MTPVRKAVRPQRRRHPRAAAGAPQEDTARLLVVVDDTDASKRVLRYVCQFGAGRRGVEIHLAYIEPHLPPALLESGGAELPQKEEQVEAALRAEQQRWTAATDRRANQILRSAQSALQRGGVARSRIHTCVSSPLDAAASVAEDVLGLARDAQCQTIVVGHRAHGWFSAFGRGHLAEQLLREADGHAVWVVD
jgi:nucleotide-binding universal stress UspA family protein